MPALGCGGPAARQPARVPVRACLFLGLYAQARPPADARRYGKARALATIASLAVNVITI